MIFRISDADSQIDTAKTKVYVNGEEVTLTGDELSLPDAGVYKVTLDAYDCAGNTTKKTVTVYVNKETLQDSLTVSSGGKTIDAKDQALVYTGHNGSTTTVTYKVTGLDLDADDIVKTVTRKAPDSAASAAGRGILRNQSEAQTAPPSACLPSVPAVSPLLPAHAPMPAAAETRPAAPPQTQLPSPSRFAYPCPSLLVPVRSICAGRVKMNGSMDNAGKTCYTA